MAENNLPFKMKMGEITLPVGVAVYPHLVAPDTKWNPDGEFRTKIKYDEKTADAIRDKITPMLDKAFDDYAKLLAENGKKAKVKSLSKADLPIKAETDEEGDETGSFLVNTKRKASGVSKKTGEKWKAKIVIADSTGKPVKTKGLSIWSGTELRVMAQVMGWYNAKDNEVGISLEIKGVQIKKLVSGGDGGVEFDAMDDGEFTASDEGDTDSSDDAADDDSTEDDDSSDF